MPTTTFLDFTADIERFLVSKKKPEDYKPVIESVFSRLTNTPEDNDEHLALLALQNRLLESRAETLVKEKTRIKEQPLKYAELYENLSELIIKTEHDSNDVELTLTRKRLEEEESKLKHLDKLFSEKREAAFRSPSIDVEALEKLQREKMAQQDKIRELEKTITKLIEDKTIIRARENVLRAKSDYYNALFMQKENKKLIRAEKKRWAKAEKAHAQCVKKIQKETAKRTKTEYKAFLTEAKKKIKMAKRIEKTHRHSKNPMDILTMSLATTEAKRLKKEIKLRELKRDAEIYDTIASTNDIASGALTIAGSALPIPLNLGPMIAGTVTAGISAFAWLRQSMLVKRAQKLAQKEGLELHGKFAKREILGAFDPRGDFSPAHLGKLAAQINKGGILFLAAALGFPPLAIGAGALFALSGGVLPGSVQSDLQKNWAKKDTVEKAKSWFMTSTASLQIAGGALLAASAALFLIPPLAPAAGALAIASAASFGASGLSWLMATNGVDLAIKAKDKVKSWFSSAKDWAQEKLFKKAPKVEPVLKEISEKKVSDIPSKPMPSTRFEESSLHAQSSAKTKAKSVHAFTPELDLISSQLKQRQKRTPTSNIEELAPPKDHPKLR